MKPRIGVLVLILVIAGLGYANSPDQPYMQAARTNLQQAKAALQRAEHNKGGHRVNAIGYINSAIGEINLGIAFDRRHGRRWHHVRSISSGLFSSLEVTTVEQPNMRTALDRLRDAKRNLEAATADKGGHRVKAMEFVNAAIDEVNRGIAAAG